MAKVWPEEKKVIAPHISFSGFEGEGGQHNDQERAGDEGDGESEDINFCMCISICICIFVSLYLYCRRGSWRRLRRRSG